MLRGKCRYCKVKISPEYMILEVVMALLFIGLYALLYLADGSGWLGAIGGEWWSSNGFFRTWPAFFAWAFLLAGLVSMTIIDARTFTIPIHIPVFITVSAFIFYVVQSFLPVKHWVDPTWPIPVVGWFHFSICAGGLIGLGVAMFLLKTGRVRYSFTDYHEYVKEGEVLAAYPHGRREMFVELLFLAPILLGFVAGYLIGGMLPDAPPPTIIQAIGGSLAGYFMGCALIWGIRILGTLGFGREAMGLGDVHLLGAIGAVLGWFDPILIFFIAPFSGILWVLLSIVLGAVFRGLKRELPYGPHLAAATIILVLARPGLQQLWEGHMPFSWPSPGLIEPSEPEPVALRFLKPDDAD